MIEESARLSALNASSAGFAPGPLSAVAQDSANGLFIRVAPPDAERVTRGVGVDLVPLGRIQISGCQQQTGTQGSGLSMRAHDVLDVEIEMDLLGIPIRPFRRVWSGASCTPITHRPSPSPQVHAPSIGCATRCQALHRGSQT